MSLSEYLAFKKANPNEDWTPGTGIFDETWVHRVLTRIPEVEPFGIDGEAMFGVLEGKQNKIDFIAFKVLEATELARQTEVKQLRSPANSHIIPKELCEYLVGLCLLSSWEHRLSVNWCLAGAAIELLGGIDERDIKRYSPHGHRHHALIIAAEMMDRGEAVSARAVARSMGVAPTTVTRLFRGNTLVELASRFRRANQT